VCLQIRQISYSRLFSKFGIPNVITLFESLLFECRIVFVSKKLSHLSECVNAAIAMLSPLSWQYVFIPVLPEALLSYCCAPMPFVVGITSGCVAEVRQLPTEEILMLDCDKGQFMQQPANVKVLTPEMRTFLNNSLERICAVCTDKSTVLSENLQPLHILSLLF
jgi:hypothetical protein